MVDFEVRKGSPKAAATFSQFGRTFSTARMVRIKRASFSGVQLTVFWPIGIVEVDGWRVRLVRRGL